MLDTAVHGLTIRRLNADDLKPAHALSVEAAWPHRIEDWLFAHAAGTAFGALDGHGRLVATALWWPFGARFATVGMVIVSRALRGHGIGRTLMHRVIVDAGSRTLILHSTAQGRRLYESLGFRAMGTVRQHQGMARAPSGAAFDLDGQLRPAEQRDLEALLALDQAATGMGRGRVVQTLGEHGHGVVLDRGGGPAGFSFFRRFGRGYVIGPVVAPNAGGAMALIGHWLSRHDGSFVRIDTPIEHPDFLLWLEQAGLAQVDAVTVMARGAAPPVSPDVRPFALVSQALS